MVSEAKPKGGLEDVVGFLGSLTWMAILRGVLHVYGYDIHDLARTSGLRSRRCATSCGTALPNRPELGDLQSQLAAARLPEHQLMEQSCPGITWTCCGNPPLVNPKDGAEATCTRRITARLCRFHRADGLGRTKMAGADGARIRPGHAASTCSPATVPVAPGGACVRPGQRVNRSWRKLAAAT